MAPKSVYYLDFIGCDYRVPFCPASASKSDVYKAALQAFSIAKADDIRAEEADEASFYENEDEDEEYDGAEFFETSEMQILRVKDNVIRSFGEIMVETDRGFVKLLKAMIAEEVEKRKEKE